MLLVAIALIFNYVLGEGDDQAEKGSQIERRILCHFYRPYPWVWLPLHLISFVSGFPMNICLCGAQWTTENINILFIVE